MIKKKVKFIAGIDEVGRGPLAGPVAVCAFIMPENFNAKELGMIKDSKKLKPQKREEIFARLKELKKEGKVNYSVCYESAKRIDKIGISKAIKNCLIKALKNINAKPNECLVLLDGGLKAPEEFKNQKTIIKGDEKERAIAFASIAAKVSRDSLMCKLAKKYKNYSFEIHKGYGTQKHCEAIKKYGLSDQHRKCFCKRFIN
ncbi:MAG: ribonuclease HII [Candidatus Paceibacterota bacterium]|jgi:ribonuclease HII